MLKPLHALTVVLVAAAAGCNSSTSGPPSTTLTPSQRQALSATLSASPQMGLYASLVPVALTYVTEYGQIQVMTDSTSAIYNAFGLWMNVNATNGGQPVVSQFFAVVAWQGVGSSIQSLSVVLGAGSGLVTDTLGAGFNGTTGGTGFFTPSSNLSTVYSATSGTFTVSSVDFSGGSTFSSGTFHGSYMPGRLGGHYSMGATTGTGPILQSADFTSGIPAVQLTVEGTF